ncbi:MAG TPA: branched-chain amino acid ABC transporter substrate-binding protein [Acidimicrobiia bacterium]
MIDGTRRPLTATVAALVVATAIGLAGVPAGAGSSKTVRIGVEAPLTGDQATLGKGMLKGAQLAARRLNERDGIGGRRVEIVPIDDAADPEKGSEAASAAIAQGLDGVVGPYNSGVGAETLPLYIDAGLVPIRLTSADSTAGLGFTLQPMTSQIAPVAATALTDWLGAKSVAIAYDPTALYTDTVSNQLRQLLEQVGVTITAFQPIEPGQKSYADVVRQLAATNPDVIYAGTYYPEGGLIAKAVLAQHFDAKCVVDYGSYDQGYVEVAGVKAANACAVVGVPAPHEFPGAKKFVAAYRAAFRSAPGAWSPYTFDSVNLLADAVEEAGGFDAAKLTDALDAVDGYEGWTGAVKLEPGSGNREPATVVLLDTNRAGIFHIDHDWAQAVGYRP